MSKIHEKLIPLICPFIFMLFWEFVGIMRFRIAPFLILLGFDESNVPDFSFLLPISEIAPQFIYLFKTAEVLPYLWSTMWRSGVGFLFSALLGFAFGAILGLNKRAENLFIPTVDAVRTLPPIALLPVIILFFGIDNTMKIVFIFIGGLWPVVINTALAVKSVDPMYIKVGFNAGHSPRFIFWKVIFPASLPGIFAGLKISLAICIILSIVCEMLIGNSGLGFFLNYSKRNFEYDTMFATLFVIAILGWFYNGLINQADKKILDWYYRSRESQMESKVESKMWKF